MTKENYLLAIAKHICNRKIKKYRTPVFTEQLFYYLLKHSDLPKITVRCLVYCLPRSPIF